MRYGDRTGRGVVEHVEPPGAPPLDVYCTSLPGRQRRAVLVFTDVFGFEYGRHRVLGEPGPGADRARQRAEAL